LKLIPASDEGLPTLLIAFDEAAKLYTNGIDSGTGPGNETPYASIRRMLRGLRRHPVWSVFISTNARVDMFLPRKEHGSARAVDGSDTEPFSSFELDIECKERIHQWPELELCKEICKFATVDHMTMFGRPLWRRYALQPYRELHSCVYMEMMGGHALFSADNIHHAFMAVASRVCLDLRFNIHSLQFARETVDYHLRLLIGVDPESGMLKTATPSEPVVADVAATMLVHNDGSKSDMEGWATCINVLSGYLLGRGIVNSGNNGELFGRLLCVLARDQLPDGLSADEDFRYSRPFKVDMFLSELLGSGTVNGLINTELQRRPHGGFAEGTLPVWDEKFDFRQGWCNFNHFVFATQKLPRDRERLQNVIRRMLRRNAALQLARFETDWDLLLPVYTGDINKPIERDHLSAIFIQFKDRQNSAKPTLATEYRDCFRPGQLVFCIQMEFGAGWQNPSAHMQWPSCKRMRDESAQVSGPFVFGMQVFGADERTFPFLAKYPHLGKQCRKLVHTRTTNSDYPDEQPVLQMLTGVDREDKGEAGISNEVGYEGACGRGMDGNGRDDTVGMGMEDDVEEDIDGSIGNDLPMSGME
jgi:hypothetical protein